ncbi:MAG: PD-(D/E)XK nuclease family transposase [Bacteroidales bacterium]|nr:PD-(D/E)XK nuclease family transposase [Bacteroidales bacterium]
MLNVYNRYADIRIDAAFKICFGTEANKDNMIGLLGLLIPDAHIVDITFMVKEFPGFVLSEKTTIFDVYCKTEDGQRINQAVPLCGACGLHRGGPRKVRQGHDNRIRQNCSAGLCPRRRSCRRP